MKKNLQKLAAIALAGVMVMGSLAGCNKEAGNETTTTAPQAGGSTTETTAAPQGGSTTETTAAPSGDVVAGIEGWTAFENNVTLSIPVYDRGAEGVPAIGTGDNYWEGWIQENFGDKYNITVDFVPITRSDVLTSYALLAAAEDLPTILMEYDYPKQAQWAADGYLAEYDLNAFAQVAPTYYQKMVDLNLLTYTEMDGHCYFALAERPFSNTNYGFATWVRMDWLRAVGYDHVPASRAEYVDAMTKIKEAGIAEYPAGGSMITGVGADQNYGYRTYPMNEEEWCMYGDYNIPSLGWEPNKLLLKVANEDYNLGFTNPEWDITQGSDAEAQFIAGQTYSWSGYFAPEMAVLKSFYEQNPDAELAVVPQATTVDPDTGLAPAFRSNNPFGMMIGFSSQATEDELKAAWMYMEWMVQEENLFQMQWGIEGEHYQVAANGLPEAIKYEGSEHTQGYNCNKDYYCVAIEARVAGTIEDLITASAPVGLPQDFTQALIDNYYAQLACWEKGWVPVDCMFATEIKASTDYQGELIEDYKVYRVELTECAPEDFDALYEQYAKDYMDAGYAEIAEQRLQALKDGLTSRYN